MKRLLFALLLFSSLSAFSQLGIKVLQFRPTGDLGMAMKKAVGAEIFYIDSNEENWRMRAGVTFSFLKPRLEPFPTPAIVSSSSGTTVIPGEQTFRKFNVIFLSTGFDYLIFNKKKYAFYPGFDLMMGGISTEYHLYYPTLSDEEFSGGNLGAGGRIRLGGEYVINGSCAAFFEYCNSLYVVKEMGIFSNNDFGIGFKYFFN